MYASRNVCFKDMDSTASLVLQNYHSIEMTSNMIYIVALGVGFKCPRKIHLNTQCPPPLLAFCHVINKQKNCQPCLHFSI